MLNQEILGISVSTIYFVVAKVINKRFGDADTDDVVYKNAMKLFIRGGFGKKKIWNASSLMHGIKEMREKKHQGMKRNSIAMNASKGYNFMKNQ